MKIYEKVLSEYKGAITSVLSACSGKRIVIYGYVGNGYYWKWLLSKYFSIEISYVIDDQSYIFDCNVYNPILLEYKDLVSCKDTIILVAKELPHNTKRLFEENGYIENKSYFYISSFFYNSSSEYVDSSFYGWLEHIYNVDLLHSLTLYSTKSMNNNYSISSVRGISNIITLLAPTQEHSIFDVGAGKGGAAICFALSGFKKVGCVEYDESVYKVLTDNLIKLGINDVVTYNADALTLTSELDAFDVFYLNNPFKYDLIDAFIHNVKDSKKRKNRHIYIIYSNPYHNRLFAEKHQFKLVERITTDYPCRLTNLYLV